MTARSLAVEALALILDKDEKPKDVLERFGADLDSRDRALLMELVYGVLRYRDLLDWRLSSFLSDPGKLKPFTRNTLRIALYQILFLRVPDFAAVNEAVETEKQKGGLSSLVNAVLRSYLRRKDTIGEPPPDDPAAQLAITTSHPRWLVERWIARFGIEEARALAEKNNEPPLLMLRIDGDREAARAALAAKGIEAEPTAVSPWGVVIKGARQSSESAESSGDAALTAADADEGIPYRRVLPRSLPLDPASYLIQDEAAQLVSFLLDPQPGEQVLDGCAAPGGKTTHIARLMKDQGDVVAVDPDADRVRLISENCRRLGLTSVRIITGDLRSAHLEGPFDRILIDAPCSSLGVIRRNPDVKYRHEEADLLRFQRLQTDLLRRAPSLLKPGGTLVYSVCSTEPEEGEAVINAFLQRQGDFSMIEGDFAYLRQVRYPCGEGIAYRTFPHRHGMDGFFAARLRKKT